MFKLDNAFLEELGLGVLPAVEKNKMLAHIYETLEMRVGMKLAEQMSNEQLDEFESYIKSKDEAGALKWLETNFPDYKQVVAQELEKLKGEISKVAPQIVAQAAENAAAQPQVQPPAGNPSQPQPQTPLAQPQPLQATQQPQFQSAPQQPPQVPQSAPQQQTMPVQQPQPQPAPAPQQQPVAPLPQQQPISQQNQQQAQSNQQPVYQPPTDSGNLAA